jgi:hypothetical protein
VITGAGLDPRHPRAEHFTAKFAAARPTADPSADPAAAWGSWLELTAGNRLADMDPRAIRVRRPLAGRRIYGTCSVSYVAFSPAGLRCDFQPVPGEVAAVSTDG